MWNTSVTGKVTDEDGTGLDGLLLAAYDVDLIGEDRLGYAKTNAGGDFTVTYGSQFIPDLKVRVFDPVGRLLFESEEHSNFSDPVFDIGRIVVPEDVARGWRVTLRTGYLYDPAAPPPAPADPYPRLSQGNLVTPMVDNELAWSALTKDVLVSEDFVHLTQLWFDVGHLVTLFNPPMPETGKPTYGVILENELVRKNRDEDITVRLLLNDFIGDPGYVDSVRDVRRFLDRWANHVELRGLARAYNIPLHAKLAVIDGRIAYLLGSPFIQGYFDGNKHLVDEPRRGIASFSRHTDNTPLHDVSVAVAGPAAAVVNDTFVELWGHAGAGIAKSAPVPSDGQAAVQIVRTLPANLVPTAPDGEAGILEAYLRAIREAEQFIFLDNQYVTEDLIAVALVNALKRVKNLEVIMVVNGKVDLPRYNSLQPNLLTRMHAALDKGERARLGVFTLWSHYASASPQRIMRTYTHAKAAVVDDKWATIGSANLDGVSLNFSQHLLRPITRSDRREEREVDVNALIFNGVNGLSPSTVPAEFRRALWAEHLGLEPGDADLGSRPADGWLPLWRRRAEAKRKGLTEVPPIGEAARVLEWRPTARPAKPNAPQNGPGRLTPAPNDPRKYLLDLGVTEEGLRYLVIQSGGRSFDFDTGQWVK